MTSSAQQRDEIDQALIMLAQKGNAEALDELLRHYEETIGIILNKRIFDKRLHEDMRQEAHLAFVRAVENYVPTKARFVTFASRVIDNALISASRKGQSVQADVTYEGDDYTSLNLVSSHDVEGEVVQTLMGEELLAQIEQLLSTAEFQVYLLDRDGYSNREIADIQGLSVRSVANALARARKKLISIR